MVKINFKDLLIQYDIEGEKVVVDSRKHVGNTIYRSNDVALADFGRVIYYSEGEVEIPANLTTGALNLLWASDLIYPIKLAIKDLIIEQMNEENNSSTTNK